MKDKTKLISSIIFNGGNSIIFLFYIKELLFNFGLVKYLTMISYYANSIFLLICFICDVLLYISDEEEDEIDKSYVLMNDEENNNDNDKGMDRREMIKIINFWNRNNYAVICNTFSFFVTISFWILFFLGETYIKVSNTFGAMLSTIYLHLIISILVIIDIFVSKRLFHFFSCYFFKRILILFLIYCAITCFNKYIFNINPYEFMNGSFLFLIAYLLFSIVILFLSYLSYVGLMRIKREIDN